jgi:hypothetical protein
MATQTTTRRKRNPTVAELKWSTYPENVSSEITQHPARVPERNLVRWPEPVLLTISTLLLREFRKGTD